MVVILIEVSLFSIYPSMIDVTLRKLAGGPADGNWRGLGANSYRCHVAKRACVIVACIYGEDYV